MRTSARALAMCLAVPAVAVALTGLASGTAAADPGCQGSMNGPWAFNGQCQGEPGTYRIEVDCLGYDFTTLPPALGQYTLRRDLPVGQAASIGCIGPGWVSAGYGVGGRVFRL
ncbi:hypothetical protein ACFC06_24495 [Nocardia sp. NPDC056064]|uniref:hypothetical protein n=1 Tax=Nocardia sp. NPDC056064 TaxID=3345701 RepID=UPI0035E315F3